MSGAGKMGDRGGSREGKKKSLNKIKQAKFKQEKDYFKDKEKAAERPKYSLPPPPLASLLHTDDNDPPPPTSSPPPLPPLRYFDSACHLSSRQFDGSLHSVVRRALSSSLLALIVTTPDFTKADEVLQLARSYPGLMYVSMGVSPDLIKKNHDKIFEQRMEKLWDLCLSPEVVCLSAGLDLTRDSYTFFLQHKLFSAQMDLALRIRLPVMVHEKGAADKLIEAISAAQAAYREAKGDEGEEEAGSLRVAVHGFSGTDEQLKAYIDAGYNIVINGTVCDLKAGKAEGTDTSPSPSTSSSSLLPDLSGDGASLFRQLRGGLLPVSRLLLCSDSPLHTPANIDDAYLRSQRNEPANLPYVYSMVATALRMSVEELCEQVDHNTREFFQLQYAHDKQQEESKEEKKESKSTEGKKGKAKVSEGKGTTELSGTKAVVAEAARKLAAARISESEEEEEEEEEEEDEEEEMGKGKGKKAVNEEDSGEDDEDDQDESEDEESEEDQEEEDEEDESSEEDSRPASASQTSTVPSITPLQAAGRRRNAKADDDENDEDGWKTGKAKKKKAASGGKAKGETKAKVEAVVDEEEEEEDGASEVVKKKGTSAVKKSSSSSRQRVIGSDVNMSLDREMVRYACRRCRNIIFSEDDLVPHRSLQNETGQPQAAGGGGGKGKKTAIDAWDRTQCESVFIRPMQWMKNIEMGGTTGSKSTAVLTTSDRIECPHCGSKLGRCGMVALYLPCSCGRQCDGPPPYFCIQLSRIDLIEHSMLLAGPRAVGKEWAEWQEEVEGEVERRRGEKKAAERLKRENKKNKKQQREDQRGNFTEFRNKSLVHAKPKGKEKEKEKGGAGGETTSKEAG